METGLYRVSHIIWVCFAEKEKIEWLMYVYGSGEKYQIIIIFSTHNSSKQLGLSAALIKTTRSEIVLFVWKIKHMHTDERS